MTTEIIVILIGIILGYYAIKNFNTLNFNVLSKQGTAIKEALVKTNHSNFEMSFTLPNKGKYVICIVGSRAVNVNDSTFSLMEDSTKSRIELNNCPPFNFLYKGKISIEVYNFSVTNAGDYSLLIENIKAVKSLSSNLPLSPSDIWGYKGKPIDDKLIVIKEYISLVKRIMVIVALVLSINLIGFGVIFLIKFYR